MRWSFDFSWLETWSRDFRHAARSLSRSPSFSVAVFGTLVVCIGPNAATLAALHALVLRPLPYPDSGRLVTVFNVAGKSGGQIVQSSTTQYLDFKAHADLFSGFATVRHATETLDENTEPVRVATDLVSANFFELLGVKPALGRFFLSSEETAGRDDVLVLSQGFWKARYNADPGVLGTRIRLGAQSYTVVGVAPQSLAALDARTCLFRPHVPPPSHFDPQTRYRGDLTLYARLKEGAASGAGLRQLQALDADFQRHRAGPRLRTLAAAAGYVLAFEPLRTGGGESQARLLWLLQGGAMLVLLIGCVNVANLFLARANARRADLAVRVALGAGRMALLRESLAESLLLTGPAAAVGIGAAAGALRLFNGYLPVLLPGAPPVTLDWVSVTFIAAATCGLAVLFGSFASRSRRRSSARLDATRTASSNAGARALGGWLVTIQVAMAFILLVDAGLLVRSFAKVMAVDPGFDAAHLVQGRITLPSRYADPALRLGIRRRIEAAIREIPGVENVAESLDSPLLSDSRPVSFSLRGQPPGGEGQPLLHIVSVSPDFFGTMGVRLLSGRTFTDADNFSRNPVAVVDSTFVERYLRGRIVEGTEIYLSWGLPLAEDGWPRIVGVVSRVRLTGLDSRDHLPLVYVPVVGFPAGSFSLLVRTRRPAAEILPEIRAGLRRIDPSLPLYSAGSLDQSFDDLLLARRGTTLLLGVFSALALILATVGLYGVLSYDVSQRFREIGVRSAIGASPARITGLIMRQGALRVGFGLAIGLAGAVLMSNRLLSLLFEVPAHDPGSYSAVFALLVAVSCLACWFPARRAARVDPVVALRAQ